MKIDRLLIVAFVLVLAVSCMKDDYDPVSYSVPLAIVPIINQDEATINHLDDYIGLYQFGIQVTNPIGTALYIPDVKNVRLFKSGTWTLSPPVSLSSSTAKIYAYHPYSAIESDLTGIGETSRLLLNIPETQLMRDQIDYLYASQDKNLPLGGNDIFYCYPNVSLRLNHALALVSFVIYKGNYSGEGVLKQLEIKDNTTLSNITVNKIGTNNLRMNLADGAITGGEASASITVKSIGNTITEITDPGTDVNVLKTKVNCYAYVIPASFTDMSNVQFILTVDDRIYAVSLSATDILSWTKGKQYIYKIELTPTFLSIVGVTVTDWEINYGGQILID